MAKKKKHTKTKDVEAQSSFWPLSASILMIVIAVFLLLGGFGAGGPLPKGMFNSVYNIFGWGAYITPIALIFWGVLKFRSENRKIPLAKFSGMLAIIISFCCFLQVSCVSINDLGEKTGGHGGYVGKIIGNATLEVIDKMPSAIMFFVFTILAIFWTFNISPKILLKPFEKKDDDTDINDLKVKDDEFKLNEGVPLEHHSSKDASNLSSLKASSKAGIDGHGALTTTSDPEWKFPPITLLNQSQDKADAGDIKGNAQIIKESLANFNINVEMEGANAGPRVTQYTLKPPAGVKMSKIATLDKNLEFDLAAQSIRIEAPIPGKRAVGIEVPNLKPATVRIAGIFTSEQWIEQHNPLSFTVGKDISGTAIVASLDRMPHILVAGQTNSGKSVMINSILTSLLYKNSPSDLKLILVDPKHVELSPYNDIPHLLAPVITEPEKCISALKWAVAEMERRYKTLAEAHRRNITEYNTQNKEESMPFIVIVIDELSDLMQMAGRDVEALIVRIAQKARAVGIHLVIATQRPSVNVITGLIKANIPARIAFTVNSQVDSRTIIDQMGAEKLLGSGDMLFSTADMPKPKRIQGALINTDEVQKVTDFLRNQRPPQYDDEVISQPVQISSRGGVVADYGMSEADEDMWRDAIQVVVDAKKASTSLLQRRLRIGYARAARLIETMEEQGIVSQADGSRPRDVLISSANEVFNQNKEPDVYDDMPDDDYANQV